MGDYISMATQIIEYPLWLRVILLSWTTTKRDTKLLKGEIEIPKA